MLSDEAVEEYRQIYKKEYKVELSKEEAREQAERLIGLFKVIYAPIPKAGEQED